MKSTIYSPNEQAFRNIDAELHALHQVEQSGVWRGNPTALRRLDDREAELCRSYIRLQCIIRHAARESPIAWQRLSLPTHPNVYRSSLPAILGTPATTAGRTGTSLSIVLVQGSPGMAACLIMHWSRI